MCLTERTMVRTSRLGELPAASSSARRHHSIVRLYALDRTQGRTDTPCKYTHTLSPIHTSHTQTHYSYPHKHTDYFSHPHTNTLPPAHTAPHVPYHTHTPTVPPLAPTTELTPVSPGELPEQRPPAIRAAAEEAHRTAQQDVRGRAHEGVLAAAGRRLRAAAGALAAAARLALPAHVQVTPTLHVMSLKL